MMELVQERRERERRVLNGEEDAAEKEDLFGSLVRAAAEEREDDGIPFGDREVIGNTCELVDHLVSGDGLGRRAATLIQSRDGRTRRREEEPDSCSVFVSSYFSSGWTRDVRLPLLLFPTFRWRRNDQRLNLLPPPLLQLCSAPDTPSLSSSSFSL